MQKEELFLESLAIMIGSLGIDDELETPGFVLARVACDAMVSFGRATADRDNYYTNFSCPNYEGTVTPC